MSGEERFSGMKAYVYGEFSSPVAVKMDDGGRGESGD